LSGVLRRFNFMIGGKMIAHFAPLGNLSLNPPNKSGLYFSSHERGLRT
jgi:hypothetical protein